MIERKVAAMFFPMLPPSVAETVIGEFLSAFGSLEKISPADVVSAVHGGSEALMRVITQLHEGSWDGTASGLMTISPLAKGMCVIGLISYMQGREIRVSPCGEGKTDIEIHCERAPSLNAVAGVLRVAWVCRQTGLCADIRWADVETPDVVSPNDDDETGVSPSLAHVAQNPVSASRFEEDANVASDVSPISAKFGETVFGDITGMTDAEIAKMVDSFLAYERDARQAKLDNKFAYGEEIVYPRFGHTTAQVFENEEEYREFLQQELEEELAELREEAVEELIAQRDGE